MPNSGTNQFLTGTWIMGAPAKCKHLLEMLSAQTPQKFKLIFCAKPRTKLKKRHKKPSLFMSLHYQSSSHVYFCVMESCAYSTYFLLHFFTFLFVLTVFFPTFFSFFFGSETVFLPHQARPMTQKPWFFETMVFLEFMVISSYVLEKPWFCKTMVFSKPWKQSNLHSLNIKYNLMAIRHQLYTSSPVQRKTMLSLSTGDDSFQY